jgi:hypothetical protein
MVLSARTGERSEKLLIYTYVDQIAELTPLLVTFNGSSFDLLATPPLAVKPKARAPHQQQRLLRHANP